MMHFDETQQSAISTAVSSHFLIIRGGAGTGKTTIITQIAYDLKSNNEDVTLCAPTGKAAARVREASRYPAQTIHRMLAFNGKCFMAGTLEGKSIIVDESSMIPSYLMAEIMKRNPKRLILVGDPAQLSPVDKGQPFHDLISLRPDLVCELTTCYRATEAVYRAAATIREGGQPVKSATSANEMWNIINTGDAVQTQRTLMSWIKAGKMDFDTDIILCPRNGDNPEQASTVKGLNKAIVDLISPRDDETFLCPGDRVINVKNCPDKDIWNGTTGSVHSVDIDGGVWMRTDIPVIDWDKTDDRKKPVMTDMVLLGKKMAGKQLQLAYAVTVHKAQGSQYRRVVFVCLGRDSHALLSRSNIYTAVTRTQQGCVVIGETAAFFAGILKTGGKRTVLQELAKATDPPKYWKR